MQKRILLVVSCFLLFLVMGGGFAVEVQGQNGIIGPVCTVDADCANDAGLVGVCRQFPDNPGEKNCFYEARPVQTNIKNKQLQESVEGDEQLTQFNKVNSAGLIFGNVGQYLASVSRLAVGPLPAGETTAITDIGSAMAFMYGEPVADVQTYAYDVARSAKFITAEPAYAQGLGFSSLNPILETWKVFRNIAYFFFVLIIMVIGFMIMFRRKIGGQTAVTAQQAIPSIIIAMLVVTFSYAIAAVLIEAMYLVMYLLLTMFGKIGDQTSYIGNNLFTTFGWRIVTSSFNGAIVVGAVIDDFIEGLNVFGDHNLGADDILGFVGGITAFFVFSIALLIGVFRLFFELLKTYVSILISIVVSPLLLMLGAVPGRSPFAGWIKSLVGNLMAFPIILIILIMHDTITGIGANPSVGNAAIAEGGFLPPYLIGGDIAGGASFLIGLGLLLISTELVTQAKKAFGASGGVFEQFGQALADSVKRGWRGDELIPGVGLTRIPGVQVPVNATGRAIRGGASGLGRQISARILQGGPRRLIPTGVDDVTGSDQSVDQRRQEPTTPRGKVPPSGKPGPAHGQTPLG